jgi:cobyrinic acid a,c-diamide synthase
LPLWAALKRDESVELPERHLGLVQPSEQKEDWIESRLESGANLLEEAGILPFLDKLKPVQFMPQQIPAVSPDALSGKTIAIARDDAFSFTYTANITLLQDMGAKICYFSPVHDDSIPVEATGLWLPGGYPELHAKKLSENKSMISSLKRFHQDGKPILAECGGFLYCMERLIDINNNEWKMLGLLKGTGMMKGKLGGLGMQTAPLPEGEVRAHTFHHSMSSGTSDPICHGIRQRTPSYPGEEVYREGSLTATYMHMFFPSNAEAVAKLFAV